MDFLVAITAFQSYFAKIICLLSNGGLSIWLSVHSISDRDHVQSAFATMKMTTTPAANISVINYFAIQWEKNKTINMWSMTEHITFISQCIKLNHSLGWCDFLKWFRDFSIKCKVHCILLFSIDYFCLLIYLCSFAYPTTVDDKL